EESAGQGRAHLGGERILALEDPEQLRPGTLDGIAGDSLLEERILKEERTEAPGRGREVEREHGRGGAAFYTDASAERIELCADLLDRGQRGERREPGLGLELPRGAGVEDDRDADGDRIGFGQHGESGLGVGGRGAQRDGGAERDPAKTGYERRSAAPSHGPTSTTAGEAWTIARSADRTRLASTPWSASRKRSAARGAPVRAAKRPVSGATPHGGRAS